MTTMTASLSMTARIEMAYRAESNSMMAFAMTRLRDYDSAWSSVQTAFTGWANALKAGRVIQNDKAYLFRSLRNVVTDELTRKAKEPKPLREFDIHSLYEPAPDHEVDEETLLNVINQVQKLPSEQREALELRFWHKMELREIAEAVGAPLSTTASRIELAILKLRELLR